MVKERQIIAKIKKLRQIEPRKDWVYLVRNNILGEEIKKDFHLSFIKFLNPFYSLGLFLFLIIGLFGFSQSSVPGDFFYPLKKFTENGQVFLAPEKEKVQAQLELADKKLADLDKIVKKNENRKLSPAIKEFQNNYSQAVKNITKSKRTDWKILDKTIKIEENKRKIETILGVNIGTEESQNSLSQIIEREIKELEQKSLTEKQKEMLDNARKDFEKGDFDEALIKIYQLSQLY